MTASVAGANGEPSPAALVRGVGLIALLLFAACLVGILTRLPGTLAAFWPANALLLGILVRSPRYAPLWAWPLWFGAYMAADLLTGGAFAPSLLLNSANVVGVAVGFLLFRGLSAEDRAFRRVRSVAYLVAVGTAAATAAGAVGGFADVALFDGTWLKGFVFWFPTELVHYLTISPVTMTCPSFWRRGARSFSRRKLGRAASALAMTAASVVLAVVIGGAGALVFPVPALVLTALLTTVFVTALCTALAAAALMLLNAHGMVGLPTEVAIPVSTSVQIGVALLAVAPLAVAAVIEERRRLLAQVRLASTVDDLTGALRRDEFHRLGENLVARQRAAHGSVAAMLIDLDHFKQVNDAFGHRVGDEVLREFADRVRTGLRTDDLFGRLGGEEFAVLLADLDVESAHAIAERLRIAQHTAAADVLSEHGPTISVGVAFADAAQVELHRLIDVADAALYRAKRTRNATMLDAIRD